MPSPPDPTGSEQLSQWGESWGPSMQPLPKGPTLLPVAYLLPFYIKEQFLTFSKANLPLHLSS